MGLFSGGGGPGFKLHEPAMVGTKLEKLSAAKGIGKGLFGVGQKFRKAARLGYYKPINGFAKAVAQGAIKVGEAL